MAQELTPDQANALVRLLIDIGAIKRPGASGIPIAPSTKILSDETKQRIAEDVAHLGPRRAQLLECLNYDLRNNNHGADAAACLTQYENRQKIIITSRDMHNKSKTIWDPTILSPIVLDLDKDGVETTDLNDGAYFDHDGNGFAEQTGWASSDDGLLVMDRNNDGIINDGKELFGNSTILGDGTKASNGFEALAGCAKNYILR
ncbi:MAG: hypothetical protein JXR79_00355 [Nitrospirae bacterium]|nr:hypothetical protein [Nitrospirota bacterium]